MRKLGRSLVVVFAVPAMAWVLSPRQATALLPESAEQRAEQAQHQPESNPSTPAEQQEQAVAPKDEQKPEQTAGQPAEEPKLDLSKYGPGTIVVETSERKLHLILENGEVLTYPVGVGKKGKSWAGTGSIQGKFLRPPWSPPKAMLREKPWLPPYIPGGASSNPMGAAAMTLNVDQYAIHGTNAPGSIGGFVSFGCIRMLNRDILDLYKRVKIGTRVVVLQ
jgi:lipoprotein-anchoring transpeptidase ErfK/SrfK